jgi:hypothetical protein
MKQARAIRKVITRVQETLQGPVIPHLQPGDHSGTPSFAAKAHSFAPQPFDWFAFSGTWSLLRKAIFPTGKARSEKPARQIKPKKDEESSKSSNPNALRGRSDRKIDDRSTQPRPGVNDVDNFAIVAPSRTKDHASVSALGIGLDPIHAPKQLFHVESRLFTVVNRLGRRRPKVTG